MIYLFIEVSMKIYNQNDELVLTAVTEAIGKCRIQH